MPYREHSLASAEARHRCNNSSNLAAGCRTGLGARIHIASTKVSGLYDVDSTVAGAGWKMPWPISQRRRCPAEFREEYAATPFLASHWRG